MGACLERLFLYYLQTIETARDKYEDGQIPDLEAATKRVSYIVITDGAPSTVLSFSHLRTSTDTLNLQLTHRRM